MAIFKIWPIVLPILAVEFFLKMSDKNRVQRTKDMLCDMVAMFLEMIQEG